MQATSPRYFIQLETPPLPLLKESQKTFDLQEQDLLTERNFEDLFKTAQANFCPSYLVARIKYRKVREGQSKYRFVDGCNFYVESSFEKLRPINIKKINYFVLKCFDTNFERITKPELSNVPIDLKDEGEFDIFVIASDPDALKPDRGRSQYVIADRIWTRGNMNERDQLREAFIWAWCSMKNNTQGADSLLKEFSVTLRQMK